jgi:hypothetical protein
VPGLFPKDRPREVAMMNSMPLPDSPRLVMALTGTVVGLISGAIIGLIALAARKLKRPSRDHFTVLACYLF